ncbi:hypothetical protein V8D89_001999 [Ganoderma adspersum]
MAAPELNEDVLNIVCDFLTDVQDLLAFSLTCSSFRPPAIRRLLSVHPVHITGGQSIRRFHAFIFAGAAARAPLLRTLDIDMRPFHRLIPPQPGDASLLIDILTSCQHLERISLRRIPFWRHLADDPGVIDAIASIQSLRSLSIQSAAAHALTLVRKVRAPLRTLGLWCFYRDGLRDDFTWRPAAFQDSLSHLAPTLEELGFHELIVDPAKTQELQDPRGPPPAPVASMPQYPAVRSLSHLFPALDGTLAVGQIHFDHEAACSAVRAANQRAQAQADDPDAPSPSPSRPWTKLDRVVCGAVPFYVLALRCPVRLAVLDARDNDHTPEFVRRCVAVALRDNPVPRLALSVALDEGLGVLELDGMFGPELGAALTHLVLGLDVVGPRALVPPAVPFGWDALLDRTLALLRPLHKLTHLHVAFHSKSYEDAGSHAPAQRALLEELARTLHPSMFDFPGTAAALVRPLPVLQVLVLTTYGYFARDETVADMTQKAAPRKVWSVSQAWRVADGSGGKALVELRDEEAERTVSREELGLPDAFKVGVGLCCRVYGPTLMQA